MNRLCGYSSRQKLIGCSEKINREKNPKIDILKKIDEWEYEDIYSILFNGKKATLRISKFEISERELCHQNIASLYGIAPKIYDYWSCSTNNHHAIVTEKEGNITLPHFLEMIKKFSNRMVIIQLVVMIYRKISMLNFICNIVHFNLDVESVMVYFDNYQLQDVKFMDFDSSYKLSKEAVPDLEEFISKDVNNFTNLSSYQKIIFSDLISFFKDFQKHLSGVNDIYFEIAREFIDGYIFKNLKENPRILELSEFQVNGRIAFIDECIDSLNIAQK